VWNKPPWQFYKD